MIRFNALLSVYFSFVNKQLFKVSKLHKNVLTLHTHLFTIVFSDKTSRIIIRKHNNSIINNNPVSYFSFCVKVDNQLSKLLKKNDIGCKARSFEKELRYTIFM